MKKYILNLFNKALHDNKGMIAYNIEKEISHAIFSYIGLDKLKDIIKKVEENNTTEKYISLAELYSLTLRDNLTKENNEIVHNYFELKEVLGKYYKSIEESK